MTENRCGEPSPPELGADGIPDVTSDTQKLFRKGVPDRPPTDEVVVYERHQERFQNLRSRQSLFLIAFAPVL